MCVWGLGHEAEEHESIFLLVLCMVLLFAMAMAANAEGYSGGNGTESDPYLISSRDDFMAIADAVNNGNELYGVYFKQTMDIDMGGEDDPWPTIGITIDNAAHQFRGIFDGDNCQITNLYVKRNDDDAGLFGYVGEGGVLRNIHVVDGDISGTYWCGGIASRNYGLIEYCSFSGYVYGSQQFIGGIVGDNHSGGIIRFCYNTGDVEGEQICDGITGRNSSSTVENCYNRGDVYASNSVRGYAGGVAGENTASSTIDNCYSTGEVDGNLACGAIAGANGESSAVQNCYYPDDMEPGLGSNTGNMENVTPKTEEEFESGEVAWELSKGTDGEGWGQNIAEGESHDQHPHFTQALDKDFDTTEVYRVTFSSTNPSYNLKFYLDPGDDVELPWPPENAKWYVGGEVFYGKNIQCDADAIAGQRILFAGEMKTAEVAGIYSPVEQILM